VKGGPVSRRYVSFVLGGARWCVPASEVVQIVRHEGVLGLPQAPPYVAGVITLRGDVVPVVDLRDRMAADGPAAREGAGAQARRRILVVRLGERTYGIVVDEVRELVDLDDDGVPDACEGRPPQLPQLASGFARRGAEELPVLDLGLALGGSN